MLYIYQYTNVLHIPAYVSDEYTYIYISVYIIYIYQYTNVWHIPSYERVPTYAYADVC